MITRITRFTLTEKHLKLIRHFQVGWQSYGQDDSELSGAPEIDPKRPYGNSAIANDIHFILTGETIGLTDSKRDCLTDTEEQRYLKLHRETETALQIVLATGSFKPGKYRCSSFLTDWKKI